MGGLLVATVVFILGRLVSKPGPGGVAIGFGVICSSILMSSNLDFIDSPAHSWPFLVPNLDNEKKSEKLPKAQVRIYA